jgi:hypothetical protein
MNEALWLRALRAADARGLLPIKRSSLTPRELAAEAGLRGEKRLSVLVDGWYYPASYGRVRGALTEEEARGIVASMEAEAPPVHPANARAQTAAPVVQESPKPRFTYCDLCGRALPP